MAMRTWCFGHVVRIYHVRPNFSLFVYVCQFLKISTLSFSIHLVWIHVSQGPLHPCQMAMDYGKEQVHFNHLTTHHTGTCREKGNCREKIKFLTYTLYTERRNEVLLLKNTFVYVKMQPNRLDETNSRKPSHNAT